jgi:hypothetical protein
MNAKALVGMVVVGVVVSAAALAADTSSTVNIRTSIEPVGRNAVAGYVKATSTVSSSFTFDLPSDIRTEKVRDVKCQGYDSNGVSKPLAINLFSRTISVTTSGAPSGTLAVGDVVKCDVIVKP